MKMLSVVTCEYVLKTVTSALGTLLSSEKMQFLLLTSMSRTAAELSVWIGVTARKASLPASITVPFELTSGNETGLWAIT